MITEERLTIAEKMIEALHIEISSINNTFDFSDDAEKSRVNLFHYQLLRSKDRLALQEVLFSLGLSSLGRSFSHVESSVHRIAQMIGLALGQKRDEGCASVLPMEDAHRIADRRRHRLLGGCESGSFDLQHTQIMITLPSHAADDGGELIAELAASGVNIFRINTAHDTPKVWKTMATFIKKINMERPHEEDIKIYVDLAGPKIRTGKIRQVATHIKAGSNKHTKTVLIVDEANETRPEGIDPKKGETSVARIAVSHTFFKTLKAGLQLTLRDDNGKMVRATVGKSLDGGWFCTLSSKVFIGEESTLEDSYNGRGSDIFNISPQSESIRLMVGDRLFIHPGESEGRGPENGEPARISCSHLRVLEFVGIGDRIFIDDGKIGTNVVEKSDDGVVCEVFQAKASGTLLKEEKGINFPDTPLEIPALTEEDRRILPVVSEFADIIGLSFCQNEADIAALHRELESLGKAGLGIVAKIETKAGVENLPDILNALLACEVPGVMIARGDLAIELGFEKLAWVQEEILDMCDAAHIPVIWATQVLENQMKAGLPSRAEITDAGLGGRAECIMLNKGLFAANTVRVLSHILKSVHLLFKKNRQLLGKNTLWKNRYDETDV